MHPHRPRRLRSGAAIRGLTSEHRLAPGDFIQPLFVVKGVGLRTPIPGMPGQFYLSADELVREAGQLWDLGVQGVALFPVIAPERKDPRAIESGNPRGLIPTAIGQLKAALPDLLVMTDVAMDPYSSDGHDGYMDPQTGEVLNDSSLEILARMAVVQARAGADVVGLSNMMDHRVGFIRRALDKGEGEGGGKDKNDLSQVAILSYAAKYCSAFYAPFRMALDSAPGRGDKQTYQMNPANVREALREAELDEREGADMLMVKPGLAYLDVLRALRTQTTLPLAVYNVSGEYAMVKAAAAQGLLNETAAMMEILLGFKRAGADIIVTYFAKAAAQYLEVRRGH